MRLFVCLLLLAGTTGLRAQSTAEDSSSFAIGYWNDNVLFEGTLNRLFGARTFPGEDDFQTANFWGRISRTSGMTAHHIDLYLNIVTSKANLVRFDLLTARWLTEVRKPGWEGRFGFGVMLAGNFGGQLLQDAYHAGSGIDRISLPYYRTMLVHAAAYGSVRTPFVSARDVSLSGIVSASFLTGSGPSYAEGGTSIAVHPASAPGLRARMHAGFVSFYKAPALYAPMFGTGFMTGYMISLNVLSSSWLSVWHTYNQYGRDKKHFGIAVGTYPVRIIDDVRFP